MNTRAAANDMRPVFGPVYGSLGEDEQARLARRLSAGVQYIAYGVCDADCDDFDLAVTGPGGQALGSDILEDDSPIVTFTAPADGEYTITAAMASCDGECGYAIVILGPAATAAAEAAAGANGACALTAARPVIMVGETIRGSLTTASCRRSDDSYADVYRLEVPSAGTVTLTMRSGAFDAYLSLRDASDTFVDSDDDGAGGTNARLTVRLQPGTYYIFANTLRGGATGEYTLGVME